MKKPLIPIVVLILTFFLTPLALGVAQLTVMVDGKLVDFPDAKPYINQDDRTLVPIRFVSEQLGAKVDWDDSARKVNIAYNEKNILIIIDQKVFYINEQAHEMDTTAVIKEDRTMVPVRFISQALGAGVIWDHDKYQVIIGTVPADNQDKQQSSSSAVRSAQATVQYTAGALNFKKIALLDTAGLEDAAKFMVNETVYLTTIGENLIFLPEIKNGEADPSTVVKIYNSERQLIAEGTLVYPPDAVIGIPVTINIELIAY